MDTVGIGVSNKTSWRSTLYVLLCVTAPGLLATICVVIKWAL